MAIRTKNLNISVICSRRFYLIFWMSKIIRHVKKVTNSEIRDHIDILFTFNINRIYRIIWKHDPVPVENQWGKKCFQFWQIIWVNVNLLFGKQLKKINEKRSLFNFLNLFFDRSNVLQMGHLFFLIYVSTYFHIFFRFKIFCIFKNFHYQFSIWKHDPVSVENQRKEIFSILTNWVNVSMVNN